VADSPRIEELRRRLLKDPASIAFAQLAEEHRRAGDLDEAIRVAETGLEQHPGYLSARVTLGRALLELGRVDEAEAEFYRVVEAAPDNLIAVRALADIHQRLRKTTGAQPDGEEAAAPAEEPPPDEVRSQEASPAPPLIVESFSGPVQGPSEAMAAQGALEVAGTAQDETGQDAAQVDVPEIDVPQIETAQVDAIESNVADSAVFVQTAVSEASEDELAAAASDAYVAELEAWLAVLDDRRHA